MTDERSATDGPPQAALTELDRARGVFLLLDLNEDLEALRAFAVGHQRSAGLRPPPSWVNEVSRHDPAESPRERLLRWSLLFKDELDVVRAARNSAAHALAVRDDDLISAVQIAGKLLLHARLQTAAGESDGSVRISDPRIAQALRFPQAEARTEPVV